MCKNIFTGKWGKHGRCHISNSGAWKKVERRILHYLNYLPLLAVWCRERYYGDSWEEKKKSIGLCLNRNTRSTTITSCPWAASPGFWLQATTPKLSSRYVEKESKIKAHLIFSLTKYSSFSSRPSSVDAALGLGQPKSQCLSRLAPCQRLWPKNSRLVPW